MKSSRHSARKTSLFFHFVCSLLLHALAFSLLLFIPVQSKGAGGYPKGEYFVSLRDEERGARAEGTRRSPAAAQGSVLKPEGKTAEAPEERAKDSATAAGVEGAAAPKQDVKDSPADVAPAASEPPAPAAPPAAAESTPAAAQQKGQEKEPAKERIPSEGEEKGQAAAVSPQAKEAPASAPQGPDPDQAVQSRPALPLPSMAAAVKEPPAPSGPKETLPLIHPDDQGSDKQIIPATEGNVLQDSFGGQTASFGSHAAAPAPATARTSGKEKEISPPAPQAKSAGKKHEIKTVRRKPKQIGRAEGRKDSQGQTIGAGADKKGAGHADEKNRNILSESPLGKVLGEALASASETVSGRPSGEAAGAAGSTSGEGAGNGTATAQSGSGVQETAGDTGAASGSGGVSDSGGTAGSNSTGLSAAGSADSDGAGSYAGRGQADGEKKANFGIVVPEALTRKDIRIAVLRKGVGTDELSLQLYRKAHSTRPGRYGRDKQEQAGAAAEKTVTKSPDNSGLFYTVTVAQAERAVYVFVLENRGDKPCAVNVAFYLYEGREAQRVKKYESREIVPGGRLSYKFIMPEAFFWDDERFSGSAEDSGSVTKFHYESGLVWREDKEPPQP